MSLRSKIFEEAKPTLAELCLAKVERFRTSAASRAAQADLAVGKTWRENVAQCDHLALAAGRTANDAQRAIDSRKRDILKPLLEGHSSIAKEWADAIIQLCRLDRDDAVLALEIYEREAALAALTEAANGEQHDQLDVILTSEGTKLADLRRRQAAGQKEAAAVQARLPRYQAIAAERLAALAV